MRPQPRPFMVETKSRRRATQPENSASFTRRHDWLDLVPPDDLPERDVNEDLGVAPAHEAFREAEKVLLGLETPVSRSKRKMLLQRRSLWLNLPGEFCPIFSLPLARRSESASGNGRRWARG